MALVGDAAVGRGGLPGQECARFHFIQDGFYFRSAGRVHLLAQRTQNFFHIGQEIVGIAALLCAAVPAVGRVIVFYIALAEHCAVFRWKIAQNALQPLQIFLVLLVFLCLGAGKIALAVQNFRQGAPIIHPLGAVDQVHIVAQRRDELGFRGLKVVFKGKFHVFRQFQTAQRRRAPFFAREKIQ